MTDTPLQYPTFRNSHARRIAAFLAKIGLEIRLAAIPETTFLPGIWIENGVLIVDEARLLYPGDLLHEAGHLAVMPPDRRATASGAFATDMGEEIATQAWSYAAALAADISLDILFHDHGYKGAGTWFRNTYESGATPGVPLLQWYGMTCQPGQSGVDGIAAAFPAMAHWLRTTPHPPRDDKGDLR